MFLCPNGRNSIREAADFGQPLQVSYALNWVSGGPLLRSLTSIPAGASNVMVAWEHSNIPVCATQVANGPRVHTANVLYVDGRVTTMGQNEVMRELFLAD